MSAFATDEPTWDSTLDDWDTYLTRVEGEVSTDEGRTLEPWIPPSNLGPMAEHHISRAHALLSRQHDLITLLEQAAAAVLQARALTVMMTESTTLQMPRFVDALS